MIIEYLLLWIEICKFLVNKHTFGIFFSLAGNPDFIYGMPFKFWPEGGGIWTWGFQSQMSVLINSLWNKRRIQSIITLCFTNSWLLFCYLRKKRKKKAAILCFRLKGTYFSPKKQTSKLLAFNFSPLLLLNQKSNLLCSYKQCHYRNFWHP